MECKFIGDRADRADLENRPVDTSTVLYTSTMSSCKDKSRLGERHLFLSDLSQFTKQCLTDTETSSFWFDEQVLQLRDLPEV